MLLLSLVAYSAPMQGGAPDPFAIEVLPEPVALVNASSGNDELFLGQFCGGVMVDATTVVTAEHCVSFRTASVVDVVLGADDLCDRSGSVSRAAVATMRHDVGPGGTLAVLELDEPLPVQPLRASWSAAIEGDDAIASGWGRLSVGGVPQCDRHDLPLTVVDDAECRSQSYRAIDGAWLLCTKPTGERNTCDGDSGGPVLVWRDAELVDVAVTMAGFGCSADAPGINITLVGLPFD